MSKKNRVVGYQADRTNQKLYFCRLACQSANQSENKQLYQNYCETAIFHLYGAFLAFLQELSKFYELKNSQPTLESIEKDLAERTQVSPEVQRLKQLTQYGFLAEVHHAYQNCQYTPKLNTLNVNEDNSNLIVNVVTLSSQWLPDDLCIREWRQELLALIDELRAGMVEY